jgi:hypothetical protein
MTARADWQARTETRTEFHKMRRLSSLAFFVLALVAGPALAANPQVEMET